MLLRVWLNTPDEKRSPTDRACFAVEFPVPTPAASLMQFRSQPVSKKLASARNLRPRSNLSKSPSGFRESAGGKAPASIRGHEIWLNPKHDR